MSKRELGLLLIGFGIGLLLAAVGVISYVIGLHHMFILGFAWRPGSIVLALPFVLIAAGFFLSRRKPGRGLPKIR